MHTAYAHAENSMYKVAKEAGCYEKISIQYFVHKQKKILYMHVGSIGFRLEALKGQMNTVKQKTRTKSTMLCSFFLGIEC